MTLRRILGFFGVLLLAAVVYLGLWPAPADVPTAPSSDEPYTWPEVAPTSPSGRILEVRPRESIQALVEQAGPGDVILIHPGTYHEEVIIKEDGITLRGLGSGDERPVLDGLGRMANGITATGNYLTVESLIFRNYQTNGVVVNGAVGVVLRDLFTENTGEYGVFPVECQDVFIEWVVATGARDTGIYVGRSRDAVIRDSEAYGNVSGIEVENSVNVLVENNYSHDNTAGLLVFVLPGLSVKETRDVVVRDNRFQNNNLPNFAEPEDIVSNVPRGTGILIMAADNVEVTGNTVTGNETVGAAVIGLRLLFPDRTEFDVGVLPEGNWIHDNTFAQNGGNPDPAAGLPGADLLWDTSGWDNAWHESNVEAFPPLLPDRSWPSFFRILYWRILSFVASFL